MKKLFKVIDHNCPFNGQGVFIKYNGDMITGIHLIIHKKGKIKRKFEQDFGDYYIYDIPVWWIRFAVMSPKYLKYIGWKNVFKVFYGTSSSTGAGYNTECKKIYQYPNLVKTEIN